MEKLKAAKDQVLETGKKGKAKLEEIQEKEWAEPTGKALKAAASVVSLIPPPVGNVLKGALSLGATVLNPDPSLADLRRAKEEIIDEMKTEVHEVAGIMTKMGGELSCLRGDMKIVLELISDKEFYEGIETIDAHHKYYFITGPNNLEMTNESFKTVEASFQISFNKHFKVQKIFKFLKLRVSKSKVWPQNAEISKFNLSGCI